MVRAQLSRLASLGIAFAYPAYQSFKALKTQDDRDDRQWLTYWVVIGAIQTAEPFADNLLSWFPFYYETKIAALIWLQHPRTQGAQVIFDQFLAPWLTANEKEIDKQLEQGMDNITKIAAQAGAKAGQVITETAQSSVQTAIQTSLNNNSESSSSTTKSS